MTDSGRARDQRVAEGVGRSRRPFGGLLAANAVSLSGTRLSMIALPWFVITTTGSAVLTGLAAFAQMTPYVLAKALAGPLVDRLGSRRVAVVGELVAAAAIAAIPLLSAIGTLPFGVFLVIVGVVGAASGPADGAKAAMVPEVADLAGVPLERVTGLMSTIERLATTVGAAASGAIVAAIGPIPALVINATTFVVAAAIIGWSAPRRKPRERSRYLQDLRDGVDFLRRDRLLRALVAMVATTNLLDAAAFGVLLPVWALETGRGPAAIGLLSAVLGGSAVGAAFLASMIGHRMPRRATFLIAYTIAGAPRFIVLAMDASLGTIIGVYVVSGFAGGFLNPILGAVILGRIPRDLMGRVSGLVTSLAWSGIPFGGLIGGWLIIGVGLSPAFVIIGGAYFITTTLPAFASGWRDMDRGSDASAPRTESSLAGP